ncbi:MAG TPA: PAS domain S-box protein, partial [Ktedonobacterales bacterium]
MTNLSQAPRDQVPDDTSSPTRLPDKWGYLALGYLAAVALHLLGGLASFELRQAFPPFLLESLLTLFAVVVLALSWGVGPSLLATLLGAGVVIFFLKARPFATLPSQAGLSDAAEWALTLLLVIVGVCVAFLISRAQRFRRRAESLSSELRATLRAMTEAVLVFDSAGYMRQANVAAQRILGLDAGDKATSRSLSEYLLALSPTDTHGQPVALEQLPTSRVLRGEVLTAADMIDLRVHLPDGREVELEATGEPMLNAQAQRLGGVCVFRDVTERRQLERRTHATLDALLAMA